MARSEGNVEVNELLSGAPAQTVGLRIGDRIISINGASLKGAPDIASLLEDGFVESQVTVGLVEGSRTRILSLRSRGLSQILASPRETVTPSAYSASLGPSSEPFANSPHLRQKP